MFERARAQDIPFPLWQPAHMNHENQPAPLAPPIPSERSFAYLFTSLALIAAVFGVYAGWSTPLICALIALSVVILFAGFRAPTLLRPFNRAWFLLGQLLERLFSPVVLGMMFFLLITPVAVVCRAFGRDALRLKKHEATSYWLSRDPPGPGAESFKNQF